MTSRYSQYSPPSGPSNPNSPARGRYPRLSSRSESSLAYDLLRKQYDATLSDLTLHRGGDRVSPHVSKAETTDTKLMGTFGRWLGKYKCKDSKNTEKPHISNPVPVVSLQAPRRPKRPSVQLPPVSAFESIVLPELEAPKLPAINQTKPRKINGKAYDALGSHPVSSWLGNMEEKFPARDVLFGTADEAEGSRSARTGSENSSDITAKQIKAERRKGRMFLDSQIPKEFHEFPDPEDWYGESDEEGGYDDDEYLWDDAGFDSVDELDATDRDIPEITVSSPDDEGAVSQRGGDSELLSVDHCYKVLWSKQRSELRSLHRLLDSLLPLARRIADLEGISLDEPDDIKALDGILGNIIEDHRRFFDLVPLARELARDQNLDMHDYKKLPQALKKVLTDRDNAKKMAHHYNKMAYKLETRIAELESRGNASDNEEYIRL
ncbi:hypothetical protein F5Y04DRAFT_271447 [Hypomontagnella monticulosa]|nr:hypothetical protein F5Y04DRAFT_271447 [Hypomontagnella monticulosa]